jgi:hypothetical protein
MTLATMSTIERDPRMQIGAYITDGIDLYEVTGMLPSPGVLGLSTVRILLENCRNLRCLEFLPDKIRSAFDLVKGPPVGRCPDAVNEIAWDSATERRAA